MTWRRAAQTLFCPLTQNHPFVSSVVDGVLLTKMPEEIMAEKQFNSVPYIIGINQQEFGWILPMVSTAGPLRLASAPIPSASHLWSQDLFLLTPSGFKAAAPFAQVDISMETFSGMAQLTPGWWRPGDPSPKLSDYLQPKNPEM